MSDTAKSGSKRRKLSSRELARLRGIAIDTNVFRSHGFRFDAQPLKELEELERWNLSVVVPEVWEKETLRHLRVWAEERVEQARKLEKLIDISTLPQRVAAEQLLATWKDETPETLAHRLWSGHVQRTKAIRLKTSWARGKQVLDNYFDGKAPFETTGQKKHEFPDALALATLEEWAESENWKAIVVTADKGCAAACDASSCLIAYPTLVDALAALAEADESRQAESKSYQQALVQMLSEEANPLRKDIIEALRLKMEGMPVQVQSFADRPDYDYEVDSTIFGRVTAPPGEADISLFSVHPHSLTFLCNFQVEMSFGVRFFHSDGRRPRGYVSRLYAPVQRQEAVIDVEAVILLGTTQVLTHSSMATASVAGLEIMDGDILVNFGHIEPAFEDYEE